MPDSKMSMSLSDIRQALGEKEIQGSNEKIIRYLATDSRQISFASETLFIALITSRRNGHQYISDAYEAGVRYFLISEAPDPIQYPDAEWVVVADTLVAFQSIAAFHRSRFQLPVIGITGSNGKTIVKEWLYQLLHPDFSVCRSPRSFNSQVGVPLSVWQLEAGYDIALFEAGISKMGEMKRLENIIKPTIGIFTNLGPAHDEGFPSRNHKLTEKWKLFENCHSIICHIDDDAVNSFAVQQEAKIISWGFRPDATYKLTHMQSSEGNTLVSWVHKDSPQNFELPFNDQASIENVIHCLIACLQIGIDADSLQTRLKGLHALHMRLEWQKGLHQSLLLNDSYSYDMASLDIALSHLKQQAGNSRLVAILSDLPGKGDFETYARVVQLLAEKGIDALVGVGIEMKKYQSLFENENIETRWFRDTDHFISAFDSMQIERSTVLIKGGRVFAFERIANALQQQQHETLLEINLSALGHNLNTFKSLVKPGTRMMVMLKAFGYGSTDAELGRWLQHHGTDYLAVAYTDEGVALRQGGIHLPIMVMNPEPGTFGQVIEHRLEPEIFSLEILHSFTTFLEEEGITDYPVHLKLDTGMHRLGLVEDDLNALLTHLQSPSCIRLQSVFTHLVASENPGEDHFTNQQVAAFEAFCRKLGETLPYSFIRHVANTAAISRHPFLHFDMVRLGIGLFGFANTMDHALHLMAATRLLTTVAQVKQVAAGQSVGYGRQAVLQRDSRIATVRIGYADGYSRRLGNGIGSMWLHGVKVPVVGNVCMDMTMLDVTGLQYVKPGDKVEVFGRNISISCLARLCDTIPYEIMTGINQRVKRILVDEPAD